MIGREVVDAIACAIMDARTGESTRELFDVLAVAGGFPTQEHVPAMFWKMVEELINREESI